MGLDPLSMVGIGISAISSLAQMQGANAAAQQQAEAANRNAEAAYRELGIRQQEAIDKASQEKSDRAKQADRELAALRVVMGETGGLGTVTAERMAIEAGANEGIDISRIEANRDREVAALQRSKEAARVGARNTGEAAALQARNTTISAGLNFMSSGVQIAAADRRQKQIIEAQKQRYPAPPTR